MSMKHLENDSYNKMYSKINELVDSVNNLQQRTNNHMCRLRLLESDEHTNKPKLDELDIAISSLEWMKHSLEEGLFNSQYYITFIESTLKKIWEC